MKKTSTLSKSLLIALSIASVSVASVAVSQAAPSKAPINEVKAAAQSKVDLKQAMMLANKAVAGDIISAEYDQEDGTINGYYDIKTIANNSEQEVKVNANTGKVMKGDTDRLDKEDLAEYNAMKRAKLSPNQAIEKANQRLKGTPLEVGFDMDFGKPVYKVDIGKGNQVHEVVIDGMTGNITRSKVSTADIDD